MTSELGKQVEQIGMDIEQLRQLLAEDPPDLAEWRPTAEFELVGRRIMAALDEMRRVVENKPR